MFRWRIGQLLECDAGRPPVDNLAENAQETAGEDPAWGQEVEMVVATLALDHNLIIERQGILVAVVELVSQRNKDRTSSQRTYSDVYTVVMTRASPAGMKTEASWRRLTGTQFGTKAVRPWCYEPDTQCGLDVAAYPQVLPPTFG